MRRAPDRVEVVSTGSGATRRHQGRGRRPRAIRLTRLVGGAYFDGTHTIENRNDGKRDACWVADAPGKPRVAWGSTLAEVRRKLTKIANAQTRPIRCHLDAGYPPRLCMLDMGHAGDCDHADPCDMGAVLRAAVTDYRAAVGAPLSQADVARRAGIDPASLSRAFGRPDAEAATVRAVCRALGLRMALVPAD